MFYTTHSEHFVDIVEPENVCIVRRTNADGTKVFICPPQQWTPNQKERLKLEKEFDPERNEMFFAKGVLLCEGDTEKCLYPALLKACGVDMDEVGLSIVEVGGKHNLPIFIKVLEAFSIPFVVVFDEDSATDKVNNEILSVVSDNKRIHMHKPDLEKAVGFITSQRGKVEAVLAFVGKGLTAKQKPILYSPLQQLLSEVRPDLVSRLT